MAGYGLDALAVAALRPGVKRWTGPFAYVLAGLEVGLRYGGFRAALRFDGEDARVEVHAAMMVLANTRLYGGVAPIAPAASAVDGMLDCVVIQGVGIPSAVRVLPQALLGRHLRSDRVLYRRCRELQIEPLVGSALPPTQLDGDLGPVDASTVVVERAAVRMLVPNPAVPVLQAAPESA